MLLHNHPKEENGESFEVHVLHVSPEEAQKLMEVLSNSLLEHPEAEGYALTLGRVVVPEAEGENE